MSERSENGPVPLTALPFKTPHTPAEHESPFATQLRLMTNQLKSISTHIETTRVDNEKNLQEILNGFSSIQGELSSVNQRLDTMEKDRVAGEKEVRQFRLMMRKFLRKQGLTDE